MERATRSAHFAVNSTMTKRTSEEAGLDDRASEGSHNNHEEDLRVDVNNNDDDSESDASEESGEAEPIPEPSSDMSVRDLRRLLDYHKQSRTVGSFLKTMSDTDSDKDSEKSCCNILHFACLDTDGARGEQKIRLILEAARQAHVDVVELIAVRQEFYTRKYAAGSWKEDDEDELTSFTPLHLLLDNHHSTVESIRVICQAWPRVVYFRDTRLDYTCTVLKDLMYDDKSDITRRVEIVKVLLETAEKTKEGAKGLVSASDEIKGGITSEWFGYSEFVCEDTALHTATTYQSHPERFIPLFLEAWPDALKYCFEVTDNCGSAPLHNVAKLKWGLCYESRIKSIVAFLSGSSLEALAVAFLFVGSTDRAFDGNFGLGFHLVKLASEETGPDCCPRLQADLQSTFQALVRRKDGSGRTLLHYIAASSSKVDEHEMRKKASKIQIRSTHARGFIGPHPEWDLDPTEDVLEESQKERARLEKRNLGHVLEVSEWILSIDPSAAFVQDVQGFNPFHYAMMMGKQWGGGLEDLAKLVPEWPHTRESASGLYPFMLAATPEHSTDEDVSTVYGLLRFDGSILLNALDHGQRESRS